APSSSSARSPPTSAASSAMSASASSTRTKPNRTRLVRVAARRSVLMPALGRPSDDVQVRAQLERRDLRAILLELAPLVQEHVAEHLLAERLGDELAVLHRRDRLVERLRQRLVPECTSL